MLSGNYQLHRPMSDLLKFINHLHFLFHHQQSLRQNPFQLPVRMPQLLQRSQRNCNLCVNMWKWAATQHNLQTMR